MLETPHVAVGAAIATKIPNPFIAIPLALASHFVLERIPHWNPHLNTEIKKYGAPTEKTTVIVFIDSTLALSIGIATAANALPNTGHAATIIAACFMSVLPDVIEAPYFFLNFRAELIKKWIIFQKSLQVDTSPAWGLLTQVVTVIAAFFWARG